MRQQIARNCLDCKGTGFYEIMKRSASTMVIKCPLCGRTEEVDPHFHYCVPQSPYLRPGKEMPR